MIVAKQTSLVIPKELTQAEFLAAVSKVSTIEASFWLHRLNNSQESFDIILRHYPDTINEFKKLVYKIVELKARHERLPWYERITRKDFTS